MVSFPRIGDIEKKVKKVLTAKKEIVFAYLYGSLLNSKKFRDVDIAVYLTHGASSKSISDIEIKLSQSLNISPDVFDLRILNGILKKNDGFALLYLERLFREGNLIINKDFEVFSNFLEEYSAKFREAENLLSEIR